MKSPQLFAICFLQLLIQINSQNQIVRCGRLGLKNLVPFLTQSFRASQHWPWHAAIYHQYKNYDPIYQCGGTLISSKSVLTAGHCVTVYNAALGPEQISVSLGRLILDTNENGVQSFGVSAIFVHPNYNSIDYANDIAIIKLSADATFNNYVQPICLWKSDRTDISEVQDKLGTVVGWGRTENGTKSNVLQQAHFPVVDFVTCLKSNRQFFGEIISDTNFCAGTRNGTSSCQGDSGGSITFEENGSYYIRGIVSVGQGKKNLITQEVECDTSQYAIFTDVAKYLSWIKTTLKYETKLLSEPAPSSQRTPSSGLPTLVNKITESSSCGRFFPESLPTLPRSHATHHWPWHAAVYHRIGESDPSYKCGGTVISSKAILTAAHCVNIEVKNISVSLGRFNLGTNESSDQSFGVALLTVHPEYNFEDYDNNIAIIHLSSDVTFNQYVQPICLWESYKRDFSEVVGEIGTVVGWGLTENGEMANVLQEASFIVVSKVKCLLSYRDALGRFLNKNNFCAGYRNGTSVCIGDSGGSLTFEENGLYYIRGVVSTALARVNQSTDSVECDVMQYSIFTDVAKYLSWIDTSLKGAAWFLSEPATSSQPTPSSRLPTVVNRITKSSSCGRLFPVSVPEVTHSHATHHWPWHAAIYHRNEESLVYQCGGTVISSKAILTAAHCLRINQVKFMAKNVSVSLGRFVLGANESSVQSFDVVDVIVHPEFNPEDNDNDIAVIKLATDAKFNSYVQPICLWESYRRAYSEIVDEIGTVVGWGQTENGEISNELQEASFEVVGQSDCLRRDRDVFGRILGQNNFCAGYRNGTIVCDGEDGGSLTFEEIGVYYIRGIVSFGLGRFNQTNGRIVCDATQYAVFTDVSLYLPWIKTTLECETRLSCEPALSAVN